MKPVSCLSVVLLLFLSVGTVRSEKLTVDPERSVMTIRAFKSGLFSAFAHNHEIEARGLEGEVVTTENQQVSLRIDTRKIKVLDPQLSADDRAEVQRTMEGPKVLDITRFPEIRFQSTSVTQKNPTLWQVSGNLTLHGQTRPVTVQVTGSGSRYSGQATVRQRDFGIQPVSLFGGTVKVKDELKIEFDIQTGSSPSMAQTGDGGEANE
ncbi:MAG: YceI family protein [Acidobacteria bacterium]|nr:MAG: YceI family protein [Acidobacteriota bacterium]